jgi:hypothetical protein
VLVVDSNVVACCWVNGPLTALAQRVSVKDPDWHAPILWRSEMRSILTGYLRDGSLTDLGSRYWQDRRARSSYRMMPHRRSR